MRQRAAQRQVSLRKADGDEEGTLGSTFAVSETPSKFEIEDNVAYSFTQPKWPTKQSRENGFGIQDEELKNFENTVGRPDLNEDFKCI
ncbi:unnamed protein product [Protopolystoma xenopodis]|uniref:Uncharacterized protein n=1 Tax=Protopolystoma xenopodis TaxID=117903 RepID=A0A3S5FBM9_9PLAT|nr:unnamed protein product [Protopolystoma xenopodis]